MKLLEHKKGGLFGWIIIVVVALFVLHYFNFIDLSGSISKIRGVVGSEKVQNVTDAVTDAVGEVVNDTTIVEATEEGPVGLNELLEDEVGVLATQALQSACTLKGGDWVFTAEEVSCTVEAGHGMDCLGDANVLQIQAGCGGAGGAFVCDEYYIGCLK